MTECGNLSEASRSVSTTSGPPLPTPRRGPLTKNCGSGWGKAEWLKVGFSNVNTLKEHIQPFRQLLMDDPSYYIFGLGETRLGPTIDDSLIQVEGFSVVQQDRNTRGGGVAQG